MFKLLIVIAIYLLTTCILLGQVPANDNCANAIPINLGSTTEGSTELSTVDNVGTCVTPNTSPGVWYSLIGTGQTITLSTSAGASYDTKLSVFAGNCGALVCIGSNDDFPGQGLNSQVTFNTVSRATYFILVHGYEDQTGTFTLASFAQPEISVSPAQLTVTLPIDSTASTDLTISNISVPGSIDLQWSMFSVENPPVAALNALSVPVPAPVVLFQITTETITALRAFDVPLAVCQNLESLISQPPADKDNFVDMVGNAIGEKNAHFYHMPILENSLQFNNKIKELPQGLNPGMHRTQESADNNINPPAIQGTGGPDVFGYEWIDSDEPGGPVFSWIDITSTGIPVILRDDASILVPLPFNFPFYGIPKSEIRICSNGYLTFGTTGGAFTNMNIPNSGQPNDIICMFWDDLNPTAGGTIHYSSSPTQFIVQYTAIRRFGTSQPNTFEVILNADGSMLIQYLDMQGLVTSSTVGIENVTGIVGLPVAFNTGYLHNNLAVQITPPIPCPWVSSIVPISGTIPAGGSQQVVIGVDASGLASGTYECLLGVLSNASNAVRVDIPITLVVETPVQPFVLVADKDIEIERQVNSEGNIHANKDIEFEEAHHSIHTGNLTAFDDVKIEEGNTIDGDVRAGDNICNEGVITGVVEDSAGIQKVEIPRVHVDAGGDDFEVDEGDTLELDPGTYDDVKVEDCGTLVLKHDGSSGEYNVESLILKEKSTLVVNVSNGAVTINVEKRLKFDEEVEVVILPNGEVDSRLVTFNFEDDEEIDIEEKARVMGTINAPQAEVTLGRCSSFKGVIYAEDIKVKRGSTFLPHGTATPMPTAQSLLARISNEPVSEQSPELNTMPAEYDLGQNYPNPFNPTTTIRIALPEAAQISLQIYNIRGQLVRTLITTNMEAGYHLVQWDGMSDAGVKVASGMYFYRINAGSFVQTKRMILMK